MLSPFLIILAAPSLPGNHLADHVGTLARYPSSYQEIICMSR